MLSIVTTTYAHICVRTLECALRHPPTIRYAGLNWTNKICIGLGRAVVHEDKLRSNKKKEEVKNIEMGLKELKTQYKLLNQEAFDLFKEILDQSLVQEWHEIVSSKCKKKTTSIFRVGRTQVTVHDSRPSQHFNLVTSRLCSGYARKMLPRR